jgi:peroxiredoxin
MRTLDVGDVAPHFELELATGGRLSLATMLESGPVLLAFYKVTCPTCQFTLPFLDRLAGGLQIYAIAQDPASRVAEFNREFATNLPTLIDAEPYPVSSAYGLTHVPSLFLVEPDGRIAWASVGFQRRELEQLAQRAGHTLFRPAERVPESKYG